MPRGRPPADRRGAHHAGRGRQQQEERQRGHAIGRSDTALQQLAALKACVTAIVVLLRAGRPVRDAGDLFQPAPMLRWLEAVAEALLAEHTQMSGKATED